MHFSTPPLVTKKGINPKIEQPQKTFFFERADGTIFSVNEQAAWTIYSGKSQTIGKRLPIPKLIGTSDGKIVNQAVSELKSIFEKEGLEKAQEYLKMAHEMELVSAKEHIIPPRNFDTIGQNGQPIKISDLQ